MLGHKLIVQSQRLARMGLGNRSVLKEGFCGVVSPLLTSDPQNQNKQARVWAGGILSANFKTSSTPDAPLANVKFIEEEEDPYDGLVEDLVAGEHEFERDRSRELSQTVEYYQNTLPSDDVVDQSVPLSLNIHQNVLAASDSVPSSVHSTAMEQVESYDCRGSVSLHSVMQSMVPEPYQPTSTAPTHVNMPGGGHQMTLKYLNDRELDLHQSRHHSTSAAYRKQITRNLSTYRILNASVDMQGVQGDIESLEKVSGGPSPQGVQGENDARFALWMKNCGQFGDCTEQLDAVRSGRKTLQQIFDEQDEQIRLAAEKLEMSLPEQSRD
ncbi:uncharacterized protein LOC135495630 isoform X2 [Lineus longissimus]|uniref:uncharacterized protein LOC135495630 isoform X2 n=1 Tax=Lineus longissimus TaxID=88925 RepID=UPI00315C92E8